MWDRLVHSPHGRISVRKFIMSLATLFVACFLFISLFSPTVFATTAAAWSDSNISYEGNAYTPFTPQSGDGLPSDITYYKFGPQSGSNVAKFIEFPSDSSPQQATSANLQNFEVSGNNYSHPSSQQPITITPVGQQATDASDPNAGTTSCAVEGIGWIVCPVSNFLAKGMDLVYGYIQSFLAVQPLATTQDNALYRAWSYMRNFANIAFVIGFMVVIYSQLTSIGLSNYNIKKILPRFVIAAVLVNISYWICAISVDVFNILGYSIQDLFIQIRNSLVGSEGNSWHIASWQSITALILSGGSGITGASISGYLGVTTAATVVISAGISGLVILLLPMLLGLLFIVLMTFIILAARQAIITILIVIAPLAFVAYLLPNTEKWFNRWRDTFSTLLFVFPAFSAVYAGAQLAASVIIQNATTINTILLGMAVQIAPIAILPLLLKLGGGVLNRVAGIVNNPTKGIFDRGKNWARGRTEQNMSAGQARMAQMRKAARGLGLKGLVKTDKNGNALLDAHGNPVKHYKRALHPYNLAHHRDYNRRRREGLKSAHDAMSEGLFTQTRAGEAIDHLGRDAALEKHAGEAANSSRYYAGIPTGATAKNLYRRELYSQAHVDEGIGKLYEEALTNHAERDLQTQINNPAGPLRNIKIRANVDAAHAKFDTEEVDSASKQTFSMEFEGPSVAARALRQQRYRIVENNKISEVIESKLNKRGESRWQRITTDTTDPDFNADFRTLRLEEVEATDSHKSAESQWNKLIESIRADGASTPTITLPADRIAAGRIQRSFQDTIYAEAAIEDIKSTAQSRAQKRFLETQEGRRLNLRAQAAKDSLEATRSEEAAIVQEWRTKKGAEGLTGEQAKTARELRNASIQKRVQDQRTTNATGVANLEYATQIQDETTGLATVAGGIDNYGARRAQASATQTIIEDFSKNVGSEKTTMSKLNDEQLYQIATDENESNERRAAAAGKIMQGSAMRTIHKLINKMAETIPDDGTEENKKRRSAVRDIQMQMTDDMSRTPFGMGDTDRGAMRRGELGQFQQTYDADGNPIIRDGKPVMEASARNIEDMTVLRAQTKLSGEAWASMDPDDRTQIVRLAESPEGREKLGLQGRTALLRAFNEATRDTINVKDDAKRDANRIAAAFGENPVFDMSESGGSTS